MSKMPLYVSLIGRLRRDRQFQWVESELDGPAKQRIYPILVLRFWCHAYASFPVILLIFDDIYGNRPALALTIFSLSGISNAMCGPIAGLYADRKGCTRAIRLGMILTVALATLFALLLILGDTRSTNIQFFVAVFQFLLGIPLSIIDGADTELLMKWSRVLNKNWSDEKRTKLEGIGTKLKYSGVAVASTFGCLLYMSLPSSEQWRPFFAALVFFLTAVLQLIGLKHLKPVEEPPPESIETEQKRSSHSNAGNVTTPANTRKTENPQARGTLGILRSSARRIIEDAVLLFWMAIIALTEGFLLLCTYFFLLLALNNLRSGSAGSSVLLLIIPLIYFVAAILAANGGTSFQRLHTRARGDGAAKTKSVADISNVFMKAAISILLFAAITVLFLRPLELLVANHDSGFTAYAIGVVALALHAIYLFTRGFANPLLRATWSNLVNRRRMAKPDTATSLAPTTALSLALASSRVVWSAGSLGALLLRIGGSRS